MRTDRTELRRVAHDAERAQTLTAANFAPGEAVLYVPHHAHGDVTHAECERGVVTSVNETYVFVRYGTALRGVATDPADLRKERIAR